MDIRKIDLNLLVVLDTLLQEAHVSRAARQLGMSQSATSSALERCRQLFGDRLLLRAGGAMQLTPRAQRLREELQPLIADIRAVLELDAHPIEDIHQTLRISMSDSLLQRLAQPLIGYLAETAPGIDLVFTPWFGPGRALDALASSEVDLALSQFPHAGASIETRVIGSQSYEVIMRRDHPAVDGFDLEAWLRWPHIMVSGRGDQSSSIDQILHQRGLARRVGVVVPSFVVVPYLVAQTDLIANSPTGNIPPELRERLTFMAPPVEIAGYDVHMAWHKRSSEDPVLRHVSDFLQDALLS